MSEADKIAALEAIIAFGPWENLELAATCEAGERTPQAREVTVGPSARVEYRGIVKVKAGEHVAAEGLIGKFLEHVFLPGKSYYTLAVKKVSTTFTALPVEVLTGGTSTQLHNNGAEIAATNEIALDGVSVVVRG